MENKVYSQEEVEVLVEAMKERQETLEALECARIIMKETKQYPRFIHRINSLIMLIEGVKEEEVQTIQAPHIDEVKPPEKDEKGNTKFKVIEKRK